MYGIYTLCLYLYNIEIRKKPKEQPKEAERPDKAAGLGNWGSSISEMWNVFVNLTFSS